MKKSGINLFSKKSNSLNFIDKIIKLDCGTSVECIKVFSYNESYMQGHFHNNPIVPGSILIECMLQALSILCKSTNAGQGKILKVSTFPVINFKRTVIPGDELLISATIENELDGRITSKVISKVEGIEVCSGMFLLLLSDKH
jgi:3-hydroxymyristoyl/3-hydroxydecanoyl-(acyl carrier protein) dehydratase